MQMVFGVLNFLGLKIFALQLLKGLIQLCSHSFPPETTRNAQKQTETTKLGVEVGGRG